MLAHCSPAALACRWRNLSLLVNPSHILVKRLFLFEPAPAAQTSNALAQATAQHLPLHDDQAQSSRLGARPAGNVSRKHMRLLMHQQEHLRMRSHRFEVAHFLMIEQR